MHKLTTMQKNKFMLLVASALVYASCGHAQLITMPGSFITADTNSTIVLNNTGLANHAAGESFQNTFKFTGDGEVRLSGSEPIRFNKLIVEKSSNTNLVLNDDITIDKSISFYGGTIDLNNKTIHLEPTAILVNENQSSRITGLRGGVVLIRTSVASSTANPGNLGAIIHAYQTIGDVTIKRGHKAQTGIFMDEGIERYYDIEFSNNELNHVQLHFDYFNTEMNGQEEARIKIYKSDDNGFHWSQQNVSTTMRNVELRGKTNISQRWTLATPDVLNAEKASSSSRLRKWPNPATNYFYVQAEADGDAHIQIFDVSGKSFGSYTEKKGTAIKIETISPGIYIIKAEGNNLDESTRVIVLDKNKNQMPGILKATGNKLN
jgi:type IX secretion system substrate protein